MVDAMSAKKTTNPEDLSKTDRIKVNHRELLSNRWAKLEDVEFDYLRSDGVWQTQSREIYHRGHGAAILLYSLDTRSIVLTKQFRFPAWVIDGDGFLLEVPAGIIEADNPYETIREETEQETGFLIGDPTLLFKAFASPGSVTEQLYYFTAPYDNAKRTGSGGGLEEEGEDIEVLEIDFVEAVEMIRSGKIVDAKTIILIQHAQVHIFDNTNEISTTN
ncbi:MAG: nudix-type nucleoside diphosphatase (YffH/AdpP family) [bacterium]|jgi:nudix-type nucleoside diphosphatase (YffH/AdpP family)